MSHVVSVPELLDGHTVLDIECLDRIYLNGYVPMLQVGGQVVTFLHDHRGMPIASPAVFEQIGTRFRQAVARFAENNDIPMIKFKKGIRKATVMEPLLRRAARAGRPRVVAIGWAQEFQLVWTARKRDTDPAKPPQFSFTKADRRVTCYYFYIWDDFWGPGFIKVCAYFPYPAKVWLNGHEHSKRAAARAGIGFTELSNGFARCDDPGRPAADLRPPLRTGRHPGVLRPVDVRAHPGAADRGNCSLRARWERSMRQVEVSRTIVFDARQARRSRGPHRRQPGPGPPGERRGAVQARPAGPQARDQAGGVFRTAIDRRCGGVTINALWRFPRKQYLKDGRALRIETVVKSPDDLGVARRLPNLPELQARARAVNTRLLHSERVGQGCVFDSPAFARISQPTLTGDGRRAPGLRFGDPRVMALARALANMLCAVTGITNKSLRALMTGLLGAPYSMNQASYDLARLSRNGLITRIPRRNLYALTADGLRFAIFYTKVHDRVLRPLIAGDQPQAPPPLRAALRVIDREVTRRIAAARLPAAA